MTFGGLMGFYRNALDYPVIKIHDHDELAIHMPTDTGMECYRFWRVIELFKRQLNGGGPGGPGDGPDNGDGPATGNITSVVRIITTTTRSLTALAF